MFIVDIEAFCKLACTVRYTRTVLYHHYMFNFFGDNTVYNKNS
jgi:hypothetical protein